MFLDIAKALSFFLSMLSLYPVVLSAFFVPGSRWQDRLIVALARVGLSGCVCLLSGLLFARPWEEDREASEHLLATLPVRVYLWTIAGVAILFLLSWFLEEFYVPCLWRQIP
ncbi:MAG: hypothetical protein WBE72_16865 [Terracidiphilus sp.]